MKYMIIEVMTREISTPVYFETLKEAKKELRHMAKDCEEHTIEDNGMTAYGTTKNDDNWDAKIFQVNI